MGTQLRRRVINANAYCDLGKASSTPNRILRLANTRKGGTETANPTKNR